jgi:hypothetical protein
MWCCYSREFRVTVQQSLLGMLVPDWDMEALLAICKLEKPSLLRSNVNVNNKLFMVVLSGEICVHIHHANNRGRTNSGYSWSKSNTALDSNSKDVSSGVVEDDDNGGAQLIRVFHAGKYM